VIPSSLHTILPPCRLSVRCASITLPLLCPPHAHQLCSVSLCLCAPWLSGALDCLRFPFLLLVVHVCVRVSLSPSLIACAFAFDSVSRPSAGGVDCSAHVAAAAWKEGGRLAIGRGEGQQAWPRSPQWRCSSSSSSCSSSCSSSTRADWGCSLSAPRAGFVQFLGDVAAEMSSRLRAAR